jgi:hypothetical protein
MQKLSGSYSQQPLVRLKLALSGSDTEGLNATFGMKIAPVVAENKRRSIWGWSIQAKRTVIPKKSDGSAVSHLATPTADRPRNVPVNSVDIRNRSQFRPEYLKE